MTAAQWAAAVSAGLGTLVTAVASLCALLPRGVRDRLHFLTPVTCVGAPLIGLGVMLDTGWHLASAEVALVVVVLAGTGPVLAAATGRVSAQRDGVVDTGSPP